MKNPTRVRNIELLQIGDKMRQIDKDIAPIIQKLQENHIKTLYSCSGSIQDHNILSSRYIVFHISGVPESVRNIHQCVRSIIQEEFAEKKVQVRIIVTNEYKIQISKLDTEDFYRIKPVIEDRCSLLEVDLKAREYRDKKWFIYKTGQNISPSDKAAYNCIRDLIPKTESSISLGFHAYNLGKDLGLEISASRDKQTNDFPTFEPFIDAIISRCKHVL